MAGKQPGRSSEPKMRCPRHHFFLNPYAEHAFTRCPKCETKTRIRKHCLMIHIDPHDMFCINKTCRYCPHCDLIIVRKEELESLLAAVCQRYRPEIIGNDYFVFGTMDRKDWRRVCQEPALQKQTLEFTFMFRDVWEYKVEPGGWRYDPGGGGVNKTA